MNDHQILATAKLRATTQRLAMLKEMRKIHGPFTVERLHKMCRSMDVVTVYRNIKSLVAVGVMREVRLKDASLRYEFSPGEETHHHHAVCNSCGYIEELSECKMHSLFSQQTSKKFKSIDEHVLEFFGTCNSCSKK
ncbi:transcriptional repressor [Candidatus Kaiserbacteria bacterium]|nr:transcriptional repressor [Candidatus Kaiserbacteria bacterium]